MAVSQAFTDVKSIKPNTRDYSEYGASYFEDGIIYCSNSRTNLVVSKQNSDDQAFYDIYFYSLSGKKTNTSFNILDTIINTSYNEGTISATENIIAFSRNYKVKKFTSKTKTNVGIFFCLKKDSIWSSLVPFPFNDENYNFGHPSLSQDGKTLYFSSDMLGGFGGYDIYKSNFENEKWSTPINLGDTINSPGSDLYPFIHSSGRLFFSTNYYDSTKTFDVYYSDFIDSVWSKPFRLSEPINTKYNDFAFICDNTTENGYFSSDRKGTDDIYQFFSTLPAFETCDTMIERNYCYHFEEAKTVNLDTIPGIYEWVFSDSTKVRSEQADHCFSGPGSYQVTLNMLDTDAVFVQTIATYDIAIEDPVEPYIICSDTVKIGQETSFDASKTNLPGKKIEQYVWIFSDKKKFVGSTITRFFDKPGTYTINLGVTFDKDEKGNVQKMCVFRDIVVE